ncbi:MAG: hypothetical protein WAL32_11200 [Terriglobales bacterium]
MSLRYLVVVLFSCSLVAQVQQGPGPANSHPMPNGSGLKVDNSKVPPDAAIITVEGICDVPPVTATKAAPSDCRTVVTREQFEKLVDSLSPEMPPPFRHDVAKSYPRVLFFSKKAKELGLDKDPRYQELMKWSSLQVLAKDLPPEAEKKAGDTAGDVELNPAYFRDPAPDNPLPGSAPEASPQGGAKQEAPATVPK